MANEAHASVHVDATPETVWRALTEPEIVKQYFFGTTVESGWQLGDSISYRGEWEGKSYEDRGTVLEVEPPRLLVTSFFSPSSGLPDVPENRQKVSYEITATDSGSTVSITQDNNADADGAEHASANWQAVLDGLAKVVATL